MAAETERLYWSRVLPFGLRNRDDSKYAALKLTQAGPIQSHHSRNPRRDYIKPLPLAVRILIVILGPLH